MKFVDWWTISDSGLSNLLLARRPVVGYLNRSMMASNRLRNTSIIMNTEALLQKPCCHWKSSLPTSNTKDCAFTNSLAAAGVCAAGNSLDADHQALPKSVLGLKVTVFGFLDRASARQDRVGCNSRLYRWTTIGDKCPIISFGAAEYSKFLSLILNLDNLPHDEYVKFSQCAHFRNTSLYFRLCATFFVYDKYLHPFMRATGLLSSCC